MVPALILVSTLFAVPLPPGVNPYFVVFHKAGAQWEQCHAGGAWDAHARKHREYIGSQMDAGKIVVAGALRDDGPLLSVGVLDVPTSEEAAAILDADPIVREKCLTYEIHPAVLKIRPAR